MRDRLARLGKTRHLNQNRLSRCQSFDLAQKGGAEALAKALAFSRLPADTAKIAVRTARTSGRDVSDVVGALERAGGIGAGAAPP